MKIRQGFVSNSSSSSFITIGVYSNEYLEIDGIDSIYIESSKGNYINGISICSNIENIGDENIKLTDISEKINFISETLNVDKDDIKLIYGNRPC